MVVDKRQVISIKGYAPKRKRLRTRGDFAAALGRSFLDLMESDWGSIELAPFLDCETLGRLACVSRRTLAMNKNIRALAARWHAAASALDKMFPLIIDDGYMSYVNEGGADQWEEEAGRDPRYAYIYPAIQKNCSAEDYIVTKDAWAEGEAVWKRVDPMTRVSLILCWQINICKAVRACPADIGKGFLFNRIDWRFMGHYDFSGYPANMLGVNFVPKWHMDRTSDAMKLMLRLVYIKCCEIDRCGDSYTQAADVFYNGWVSSNWVDYSRYTFAWNVLTDCDEDEFVMTKENAWNLCHSIEPMTVIGSCLGARTTNRLRICRGEEDLPRGWEKLFDNVDYLVM